MGCFSWSNHADEFESVSFQFVLRPEVSIFGCAGVAMSSDTNVSAACPSNAAAPNGKPINTHQLCNEEAEAGSTTVTKAGSLLIAN